MITIEKIAKSIKKRIDLVILAGGKGKRLKSITKNKVPKPLVKINGTPFLDYLLIKKISFRLLFLNKFKSYTQRTVNLASLNKNFLLVHFF